MKKIIIATSIAIIVSLAALLGLLDANFSFDDISDQEYQVSLQKAVTILRDEYQEEKVSRIQFNQLKEEQSNKKMYEYIFYTPDRVVTVNPISGKSRVVEESQKEPGQFFSLKTIQQVKHPQTAMKEAVHKVGKQQGKAKSWEITTKSGQLYYRIAVDGKNHLEDVLISA
ncbi:MULTISPECIES: hypothetical protein [Enterococcus]|uniref:Peptidase n=1 Tax=Candidatus Enterococcus mangumiae TaxID=2230878 RepID=A0ABZ2SSP7_9ENTE|nr:MULTISPECIES: hypothetical protein [unclassified Enterococcus]MBO0462487.1 hypothetical protein [Enterococcus sp. DIV1298c]MBO0488962.1 hypothetical protein [Enterococcus sp. DIV1094]MBO1301041.1 hypothetical protein [Enterococcus sp. DIV1271a]